MPTSQLALSSARQLARAARRGRAHRSHRHRHRQGRHRAEPQRRERRRVPGDADGAAPGAAPTSAIRLRGIMSHLALRRRPRQPRQRSSGAAAQRHADAGRATRVCTSRSRTCRNSPAAMTRPDLAYDMVRTGHRGLRPDPDTGARRHGPAAGDDTEMPCCAGPVGHAPATACPTGTPGSPTATPRWRCCRSVTPTVCSARLSGRIDVLINGRLRPQRRPHLHGPVRRRPRPRTQVDVAEGDEAILFGPGTHGEPTAQDWADTARHHQLRGRHQSARPGHSDVPRRRRRAEPLSDNDPKRPRRRSQCAAGWRAPRGWRRSAPSPGCPSPGR